MTNWYEQLNWTTTTGTGGYTTSTGDYTVEQLQVSFYRINELCSFSEGGIFKEPLDELRIKVAKWLK
jgi:hypothetical protein